MVSTVEESQNRAFADLNALIEKEVRIWALPPIKGEITKGKLKWRGISLRKLSAGFRAQHYQVMQRGKPIGNIIRLSI